MKKAILKLIVFGAVFVLALVVVSRIMNTGHDNLTMEMPSATLPTITMEWDGIAYNELHGYVGSPDIAFQRDTLTVLDESREVKFRVAAYGRTVTGIAFEVRSAEGGRLIENGEIMGYQSDADLMEGGIALKDLIEQGEEYSLTIFLELDGYQKIAYYTRVIWSQELAVGEKLAYVIDFHERLYDREAARELTKYMETDSRLEDNTSFHNVNIHSSFQQLTWGALNVREQMKPVIYLTDIAGQTALIRMEYIVSTSGGSGLTYYMVEEHYRLRYTPDRMYLLDYQRDMTQIPREENMYGNDKILLGITSPDVAMKESGDGNIVAFEVAGRLFSYNSTTNELTRIFCFYDAENGDARTLYRQHGIKILDVDEDGNVQFAVFGYMNRGRHEGEVGIQICVYNSTLKTTEELIYIPYDKTYAVLAEELSRLFYLNRNGQLYFAMDDLVYRIDLENKLPGRLLTVHEDGSLLISDNHRIAVWAEGASLYGSRIMNIRNLGTDMQYTITVGEDEAIRPIGFMEEDVIYGVAKKDTIVRERSGGVFFPMYKLCICDASGETLKEYRQPEVCVTNCTVDGNQITLERVKLLEGGGYRELEQDHIMNSLEAGTGKNVIVTADIDRYERYVQIKTLKVINSKTIKFLTPKEVVYEGGRLLELPDAGNGERYYACGSYGVHDIYISPAEAVKLSYSIYGYVLDNKGQCIWRRGNRVNRNQIMAIKEPSKTEPGESLQACLNAIFKLEGMVQNSEYLLRGRTALQALEAGMEGCQVLDLTGCSLDAMLYFVNRDVPVLALLESGEAVLVTGFNETQVVIFEPSSGRLYKRGMNDAAGWLEENGNCFIAYVKK